MEYYLELCENPIRFDPVSQNVSVFFDETKKQIFSVRSGNITVKNAEKKQIHNFCMENLNQIIAIKFNAENSILAIQRSETIELYSFANDQVVTNSKITYDAKKTQIYGLVWIQTTELAIVTADGVELFQIQLAKKSLKSIKSIQISSKWFCFSDHGGFALLCSNDEMFLTPILLKQGAINKLNRIEQMGSRVQERDVTLGLLYGVPTILLLKPTRSRTLEIEVYQLSGVGLSPKKTHILQVGYSGRVAINIIDNVIVVHHQTSATSLLFDIALNGEMDQQNKIMYHLPLTSGRTIKPCKLKLPSLSYKESSLNCDLYSVNWVLFQPNIVIDAKLGCLWLLELKLKPVCQIITDRVKLVEFLLQRQNAKEFILEILKEMLSNDEDSAVRLPILEVIFNRLNNLYKKKLDIDIQFQTALATSPFGKDKEPAPKSDAPNFVIDQSDMNIQIFGNVNGNVMLGKVLLIYVCSLIRNSITCECDLSKTLIHNLTQNQNLQTLQQILSYAILNESKPLACFLLSLSKVDPVISQMSLDMLKRLNANDIIIEILLEQGRVVDAVKLAKQTTDQLPARKYLEAAMKTKSDLMFYTVYTYFQQQNVKSRGSPDFLKTEQCDEFVTHFNKTYDCSKIY